jgi:hypothetical protein
VVKGSLGTSNKNSYGVRNYNYIVDNLGNSMSDETGLINSEANDVPIITDLLAAYIQGNKNSLNNQWDSAIFNGIFGAIGNVMTKNPLGVISGAGNSYFEMQGILAKQKDIANTPPNLTKQGSNSSYTIGNGYNGVYVVKKQIKAEYIKKLSDFFKMYGYKVNEVKIPNFHTRQNYNFIKTVGANITGNIPNKDLLKIKEMFDNGITLWHTEDLYDYSMGNPEI